MWLSQAGIWLYGLDVSPGGVEEPGHAVTGIGAGHGLSGEQWRRGVRVVRASYVEADTAAYHSGPALAGPAQRIVGADHSGY